MNNTKKLKLMVDLLNHKLGSLEDEIFKDWPTNTIGRQATKGLLLNKSLNIEVEGCHIIVIQSKYGIEIKD